MKTLPNPLIPGEFSLQLVLKKTLTDRLAWDLSLTETLLSFDLQRIRQHVFTSPHGSSQILQDLFDIHTAATDIPCIRLTGDLTRIHGIGRGWEKGRLEILGDTGDCLGEGMLSGLLNVTGNAGDFVGRGMRGGRIVVQGNVGEGTGSPEPGRLRGMTAGEILIHGNAGKNLGKRMRRGTILVHGETATGVGQEMLAGTILLVSTPLAPVGLGMKRGSIILFDPPAKLDQILKPHFDYATHYEPIFMRVLLRYLKASTAWSSAEDFLHVSYDRYSGDMLHGGRGEILVCCQNPAQQILSNKSSHTSGQVHKD